MKCTESSLNQAIKAIEIYHNQTPSTDLKIQAKDSIAKFMLHYKFGNNFDLTDPGMPLIFYAVEHKILAPQIVVFNRCSDELQKQVLSQSYRSFDLFQWALMHKNYTFALDFLDILYSSGLFPIKPEYLSSLAKTLKEAAEDPNEFLILEKILKNQKYINVLNYPNAPQQAPPNHSVFFEFVKFDNLDFISKFKNYIMRKSMLSMYDEILNKEKFDLIESFIKTFQKPEFSNKAKLSSFIYSAAQKYYSHYHSGTLTNEISQRYENLFDTILEADNTNSEFVKLKILEYLTLAHRTLVPHNLIKFISNPHLITYLVNKKKKYPQMNLTFTLYICAREGYTESLKILKKSFPNKKRALESFKSHNLSLINIFKFAVFKSFEKFQIINNIFDFKSLDVARIEPFAMRQFIFLALENDNFNLLKPFISRTKHSIKFMNKDIFGLFSPKESNLLDYSFHAFSSRCKNLESVNFFLDVAKVFIEKKYNTNQSSPQLELRSNIAEHLCLIYENNDSTPEIKSRLEAFAQEQGFSHTIFNFSTSSFALRKSQFNFNPFLSRILETKGVYNSMLSKEISDYKNKFNSLTVKDFCDNVFTACLAHFKKHNNVSVVDYQNFGPFLFKFILSLKNYLPYEPYKITFIPQYMMLKIFEERLESDQQTPDLITKLKPCVEEFYHAHRRYPLTAIHPAITLEATKNKPAYASFVLLLLSLPGHPALMMRVTNTLLNDYLHFFSGQQNKYVKSFFSLINFNSPEIIKFLENLSLHDFNSSLIYEKINSVTLLSNYNKILTNIARSLLCIEEHTQPQEIIERAFCYFNENVDYSNNSTNLQSIRLTKSILFYLFSNNKFALNSDSYIYQQSFLLELYNKLKETENSKQFFHILDICLGVGNVARTPIKKFLARVDKDPNLCIEFYTLFQFYENSLNLQAGIPRIRIFMHSGSFNLMSKISNPENSHLTEAFFEAISNYTSLLHNQRIEFTTAETVKIIQSNNAHLIHALCESSATRGSFLREQSATSPQIVDRPLLLYAIQSNKYDSYSYLRTRFKHHFSSKSLNIINEDPILKRRMKSFDKRLEIQKLRSLENFLKNCTPDGFACLNLEELRQEPNLVYNTSVINKFYKNDSISIDSLYQDFSYLFDPFIPSRNSKEYFNHLRYISGEELYSFVTVYFQDLIIKSEDIKKGAIPPMEAIDNDFFDFIPDFSPQVMTNRTSSFILSSSSTTPQIGDQTTDQSQLLFSNPKDNSDTLRKRPYDQMT